MNPRPLAAALLASLFAAPAFAAPPTDEQIQTLIEKVKTAATPPPGARSVSIKALSEAVTQNLADVPLNEATLPQIEKLVDAQYFAGNAQVSAALFPLLTDLAKHPDRDGARAAELRLLFAPPYTPPADAKERPKALNAWYESVRPVLLDALKHPAAAELVKSGKGGITLIRVGGTPGPIVKADRLLDLAEPLILPEMSLETAACLGELVMKVADPQVGLDRQRQVALWNRIAAAADAALARPVPAGQDRLAAAVGEIALRAKSPAIRGELLNNPAPEVPFSWCSDEKLKSLADTRGSVVLVGFWATIYEPTMHNFPRLRELTARYREAGSPVRVITVTSLQGRHVKPAKEPGAKPQRIDCKGDPKKEYDLMAELMLDLPITWTVAFSPQSCFNPSFGVIGVPHFALIDSTGKVRANELRPDSAADFKTLADQIDALLKEGGLKAPAEPMLAPAPPPPITQPPAAAPQAPAPQPAAPAK